MKEEIMNWVSDNFDDETAEFYVKNEGIARFDYNRWLGGYDD